MKGIDGETPLMVMNICGTINFIKIKNINDREWEIDNDEYKSMSPYRLWDGKIWSFIKKVTRHQTSGETCRITTFSGQLTVTDEYPLIQQINNETLITYNVYPLKNVLYNNNPFKIPSQNIECLQKTESEHYAFVLGAIFACNKDSTKFDLVSENETLLRRCKFFLEKKHSIKFVIVKNKGLFSLRPGMDEPEIIKKYQIFYDDDKDKIVPKCILKCKYIYKHFICGFCKANISTVHGQIGTAGLVFILNFLGTKFDIIEKSPNVFSIIQQTFKYRGMVRSVKKINPLSMYSYNVQTVSGKFQCGIGTTIVKCVN
jgi:hypothetical protein